METKKILVISLGSISTKIAYYENDTCVMSDESIHPVMVSKLCKKVTRQYSLRKQAILDFMRLHRIRLNDLDSITSRGGQTEPLCGGTYRINAAMVEQIQSGEYGHHICGVGVMIAYDLCRESNHAVPLTTDPPTTDEMEPVARYTGLKELRRVSCFQALNTRALARDYAKEQGKDFEKVRVVTVMLGGGISVCAIRNGRIVDAPDSLEGEGPFSDNRCCTVPVGQLVKLCYSGKYDREEMLRHINGEAGLMAYMETTDIPTIISRIAGGDTYAEEVLDAMCYQTAKEIGAMATVLEGRVDAILLLGRMANVPFIVDHITKRVEFIAPVKVIPDEREMEALAQGSYRALKGEIPILDFMPKPEVSPDSSYTCF